MSVSHPLIREIKGCYLKLYRDQETLGQINDTNENLEAFCNCIEKIYLFGTRIRQSNFGDKGICVWNWIQHIASDEKYKYYDIPLSFCRCWELTRDDRSTQTALGKLRLFIRCSLNHKCPHTPIALLRRLDLAREIYEPECSIIGNEILAELCTSILVQCEKINFRLDLSNSAFLDKSWLLPQMEKFELVPSSALGISVSFAQGKAVIVGIKPNGLVADQTPRVQVGDIIHELNGEVVTQNAKGLLNRIVKKSNGRPITLTIIKARSTDSAHLYKPIQSLHVELKLDARKREKQCENNAIKETCEYRPMYVGNLFMNNNGGIKDICKAIRKVIILAGGRSSTKEKYTIVNQEVYFEVVEMGVKIYDLNKKNMMFNHTYMSISACGNIFEVPNYFGYMVATTESDGTTSYTCYVFKLNCEKSIKFILTSIGQGFHRTHFAV